MISDSYIEFLKEELKSLYAEYDNKYELLKESAKNNTASERYFSGSSEALCIYEPSLINRLRCNWCLKGSFKDKKPRTKTYHLISFDDDGNVIKINFYDDVSNNYQDNYKEIFFVNDELKKIYLLFDSINREQSPQLREIYLLKYNDLHQLAEYVHIPSKALSRDLTGEIHKYKNHNLIETIQYSTWYSKFEKYEFSYGEDGYMNAYKCYNLKKEQPHIYNVKFTPKDIEPFEKCGRFYFSPENKSCMGGISNF